jgi:hypothetical protein
LNLFSLNIGFKQAASGQQHTFFDSSNNFDYICSNQYWFFFYFSLPKLYYLLGYYFRRSHTVRIFFTFARFVYSKKFLTFIQISFSIRCDIIVFLVIFSYFLHKDQETSDIFGLTFLCFILVLASSH